MKYKWSIFLIAYVCKNQLCWDSKYRWGIIPHHMVRLITKNGELVFCHWAAEQQILWVVSLWRICITFAWPRSSQKTSQLQSHLANQNTIWQYFALIRLCMALLFIIPISSLHYPLSWHPSFIDNPLWTSGFESQFRYSLSTNIFLFQMNAVA